MDITQQQISQWQKDFANASPEEMLKFFLTKFKTSIILASSFGAEDQVLTHLTAKIDPNINVFTLDTGRLHEHTYRIQAQTRDKYGINIQNYFPDRVAVEKMVAQYGPNLFYQSLEMRKLCCKIRKLDSLQRALQDRSAWITGLRRQQSQTRVNVEKVEWDQKYQLLKINPLADWQENEVWEFITKYAVPYNQLHDQGYPSIGCEPCTRAIDVGEDLRSGRWWWESKEHKECGLHQGKVAES